MTDPRAPGPIAPDWEAFYSNYRKPGYVPGYELLHKLGGGAFGVVYRARKQSIGKDYAIKFLKVDDVEVRSAVLQELEHVRHFAQVDHPNLVAIEDRGEVDGIPYLVMGYAGSETLQTRLPCKDAAQREELVGLYLQACRGVQALHERSLVHFDLKPANVFLKGGVARVGDYGLSRLQAHSHASLTMGRGTPYYMAPELLKRKGDWRSDVYSLGVMLYEILTGELPFQGSSEWEVLRKHEREPPRFPPELDRNRRLVLERCLQKEPADRFQSVSELMSALGAPLSAAAAAWNQALAATAAPAKAAARPAQAWVPPPARRSRMGTGALVMVIGFCLIAAMWSFRGGSQSAEARNRVRSEVARAERAARDRARSPALAVPTAGRSLADHVRAFDLAAAAAVNDAGRRGGRQVRLQSLGWMCETCDLVETERCAELLAAFAEAEEFSPGHAAKLELDGYPMFLAAVDCLQRLDYSKQDQSRRGSHIGAFLQQATGMRSIAISGLAGSSDATTAKRNRAAADQWRKFAEGFCRSQQAWRNTLEAAKSGARATGN